MPSIETSSTRRSASTSAAGSGSSRGASRGTGAASVVSPFVTRAFVAAESHMGHLPIARHLMGTWRKLFELLIHDPLEPIDDEGGREERGDRGQARLIVPRVLVCL